MRAGAGMLLLALAPLWLASCTGRHEARTLKLAPPFEYVRVQTDDGAELVLHHYPPWGATVSDVPVLVCHGIASNTRTWALGMGRDIGTALAQRGFDTYLVNLRGHGESSPAPPETSMDTYALHDVPAIIATVRGLTGAEEVAWVGHSLGGMVFVAYLEQTPDPPVAAAVTVASPLDWRADDFITELARTLIKGFQHGGAVPARGLGAFYAQWGGQIPMDLDKIVYAQDNMERAALADMMRVGMSPIQAGVLQQFARSVEAGAFLSADGSKNYLEGAAGIQVPFLVIAGRADRLCPPERTVVFFDTLGSADKTWRVFGRDQGDARDYGHVDLCNGDHAAEDVYPVIADWLTERLSPSP